MERVGNIKVADVPCLISTANYPNGRIAIILTCLDGEPYATVSVNLPDHPMDEGEFAIHHDIGDHILDPLLACGLFEDTGMKVSYGFVVDQPVWRLK